MVQGLRAQDYRTADTSIPQKLELRKNTVAWADHPGYFDSPDSANYFVSFAKKQDEGDTARSILYLGPPRADTFDLNLPRQQANHLTLRASMRRQQPLFRIEQ
ncbi:MAG TPA: hypothetical protein VGS79_00150 [Puia sp.]|nr:hypothetical protein [Puia sp.]